MSRRPLVLLALAPPAASAGRRALERPSAKWLHEFLAAVRVRRPTHAGYLVCPRSSDELVGVVNISEIVRGAFRSGAS